MTGNEIRRKFLDYFKDKNHSEVSSSSLIPKDDPTLLFTNAGMVQFKNVFLGLDKRSYSRATTSQKCVRAGGKHNDLDNVGYTARHHTFFEMLGNFSFGDYFKKEAIEFAWELITEVYKLPEDKLWVTVFRDDDEAYDLWKDHIKVSTDRLVRCDEEDNFWSMGDTGPCGPCSEILIDQGEEFSCGKESCQFGCDCDRYLELWNLVFMQYDRNTSGELTPLPNPSIDTGMGLERMAAVLQGVKSNYETDLLRGIIDKIAELSNTDYKDGAKDSDFSIRVIADHARAVNFLISDGVFPSNEGRGYVLRRILRRAVRHAKMLGMEDPFLYKILPSVNKTFGEIYPELVERSEFVSNVVKNEEERFLETIDRGLELLEAEVGKLNDKKILSGDVAFKLYDTYGFPYDLTEDITSSRGITIDKPGFDSEMDKQRTQSRKSWKGAGDETLSALYNEFISGGLFVDFVGYERTESDAQVSVIIKENMISDSASEGDIVELITDNTPFYGESGGQVGDRGKISSDKFTANIIDTKKPFPNFIVHVAEIKKGTVWVGDKVKLEVDKKLRRGTESHHTATHILHAALNEILGDHVKQAGSLVTEDKLRFDFSHFSAIDKNELNKIEELVNERVRLDDKVTTEVDVPYDDAIGMGATAIFEEKYGDKVRVVSIGDYSKELCGGTHLHSAGEGSLIKIVNEEASSAGVRRIEAVSSEAGLNYINETEGLIKNASSLLNVKNSEIITQLTKLVSDNERLKKEYSSLKNRTLGDSAADLLDEVAEVNGIKFLSKEILGSGSGELRTIWDNLKQKIKSGVVVLGSKDSEKVYLLVGVTKDLTSKYHAGNIVKELAENVGGRGGGKPDLAQAGGSEPGKLQDTLLKSKEIVQRIS